MPGSRGTTGELREESGFFFKMQLSNRLSVVPRHSVLEDKYNELPIKKKQRRNVSRQRFHKLIVIVRYFIVRATM